MVGGTNRKDGGWSNGALVALAELGQFLGNVRWVPRRYVDRDRSRAIGSLTELRRKRAGLRFPAPVSYASAMANPIQTPIQTPASNASPRPGLLLMIGGKASAGRGAGNRL